MKVCYLKGSALNWAVAYAEEVNFKENRTTKIQNLDNITSTLILRETFPGSGFFERYSPSTNWGQGGLIIERENINIRRCYNNGIPNTGFDSWKAQIDFKNQILVYGDAFDYGETALVAAMRCYVVSIVGREINIPDSLLYK